MSFDSVCFEKEIHHLELETFSPKMLNAINCFKLPPHKLDLKVGVSVMLLRNIDQSNGLCNARRLQVRRMGKHVIQCQILTRKKLVTLCLYHR